MAIDINDFLTTWIPILNLLLVIFAVIPLFVKLFTRKADEHIYTTPWKLLCLAVGLFVTITVLTKLRGFGIVSYNHFIVNGAMEIGIITVFIYMLLLQKDHISKEIHSKRF
jgi:hypothetical protein